MGPRMGGASRRMGPMGSKLRSTSSTLAGVPAGVFRSAVPSRPGTATGAPDRELPLPATRGCDPAAFSAAGRSGQLARRCSSASTCCAATHGGAPGSACSATPCGCPSPTASSAAAYGDASRAARTAAHRGPSTSTRSAATRGSPSASTGSAATRGSPPTSTRSAATRGSPPTGIGSTAAWGGPSGEGC